MRSFVLERSAHARARNIFRWLSVLLLDDAPASWVVGASAMIGLAVALHVFGAAYILGTSSFWSYPVGDAGMMLNGWNYLVHEEWGWPLTFTHATHWPTGLSILYLDSIPLIAILGKIFARILPIQFQPYGIWHAAMYVLQAIFGALAARAVGVRSLLGGAAYAALSVSASVFLLRFFHEGLGGHFVILWAFCLYFQGRKAHSTPRMAAAWAICLVCSLLIHPYLAAMSLAIAASAHVDLGLRAPRAAALSGAICAAALTVAWFSAGFTVIPSMRGDIESLRIMSMNLLSVFLPVRSHFSRWLPSSDVLDTTGMQWDAHNFAGFGVLALLAIGIGAARADLRRVIVRHKVLAIALTLLAVFALGPRWTVGHHVLFEYSLPDVIGLKLATFRASGRLFWPVTYALMLLGATLVARRFGRRGVVMVAVAAIAQTWDSSPTWAFVSSSLVSPWEHYLDWAKWEPALSGHRATAMFPSHNCWRVMPGERVSRIEREIEFLSASHGLQTNDGHTARFFSDCAWQDAEVERTTAQGMEPGIVYVLFRPVFDEAAAAAFGGDRCVDAGEAWICSADRSGAIRTIFSSPAGSSGSHH